MAELDAWGNPSDNALDSWKTDFNRPRTARLTPGDLSGPDRDAASALIQLFEQYGLETLAPKIIDFVKRGYGADTIAVLLQDTKEWKQRFIGNEQRRNAGLAVLSPAEYISVERSYRQVFQQYGLPSGFYDSPSDFAGMIGRDLSPQELQTRVSTASQFAHSQDQSTKDSLRRLYGLGQGDLAAWALDPERAQPLLEKQARAVQAGAAALRQGLNTDRVNAERLADLNLSQQQYEQGYGQIAEMLPTLNTLGHIYGENYSQKSAERDVFEGNAESGRKRKRLASQERAAFSGSSRGQVGRTSGTSY